ncbi:hypothetical protein [Mannheimia pernigra]|uniref:hypothetical protein n=1 Tax=Mannheimia pernigra TaxID=111844 RepID=UPI001315FF53|nr:hypothetical protein [Mannheimia pernigra]QHB16680.1 hypothetical protein GM695_00655 [Mannheimia pernigra]
MSNPAYPYIKQAVERAIPDLNLNEAPHLVINEKSIDVLLDYDVTTMKKAMSLIKRHFPKYHFKYECEVNCVSITITRNVFL